MANKTQIANLAAGHIGISIPIDDIDSVTETSAEADAFNLHYELLLQEVLEKWQPDWAQKYATLTLVESNPVTEWGYSYRYPTDCLVPLRVSSGQRPAYGEFEEIPFQESSDDTGKLIWTDQDSARLHYIKDFDLETAFPASFANALSFMIASRMYPIVTESVGSSKENALMQKGELMMARAMATHYNSRGQETRPDAETIRTRG